jgi:hypothetical protein
MTAIDNGNTDIAQLIAINRLIDYIKDGKITFDTSCTVKIPIIERTNYI